MNNQNIMLEISLPYGKSQKTENENQYGLMNAENNSFDKPLST